MHIVDEKNKFLNALQEFPVSEPGLLFDKNNSSVESIEIADTIVNKYVNEFWTSKQRQANKLHEIAYRACFKAQLPNFFINHFTKPSDTIYDPFAGRGTTVIEGALLNRNIIANDINPLSKILIKGRLFIPDMKEVENRFEKIFQSEEDEIEIDLTMFFHKETLKEILKLRRYLKQRRQNNEEDEIDDWIRMIATNRLTGHSPGYFSVYTLPPNQAVTADRQIAINQRLKQEPPYRNIKENVLKKSIILIKDLTPDKINILKNVGKKAIYLNEDATDTKAIVSNSVKLTVTSPPFLDVINYTEDNWLRCWFNNIDADEVARKITVVKRLDEWCFKMQNVFNELFRITQHDGYVAFEVGEIRNGKIKLEENVIPLGINSGFTCVALMINAQNFTKTSNIWGVKNNTHGTNTNRIVIFHKN